MFKTAVILFLTALGAVSLAGAQNSQKPNSLVLVFKDGHQKNFSMSEISRIEFDPTRVYLKNGHQETFAPGEIVRIDMGGASTEGGVLGRNHFAGKWKVGTGVGGNFYMTLHRDGTAEKTIGAKHGTWVVENGEARISWDDGWHDAIRKVGNKHEKCAYEPGKSFDDQPSNVANAENVNPQPI
jgi:hypothetical protein